MVGPDIRPPGKASGFEVIKNEAAIIRLLGQKAAAYFNDEVSVLRVLWVQVFSSLLV